MDDAEKLGDELDGQGRDPTQRRTDEEGEGDAPVDAPWGAEDRPDD
ncbi:MAG: hypothetical protein ACM33B_07250 [Pseudomonadota bacterium]